MFSRVSVTLAPCLDVQYFTQQYCSTLTFHVSSSCWASWSWLSSSVCITNTLMLLKKSTQLYTGGINVIFKSYLFISLLRIHISHSWQVETNVSRHRGLIPSWSSNSPAALLFIYIFIYLLKEEKRTKQKRVRFSSKCSKWKVKLFAASCSTANHHWVTESSAALMTLRFDDLL